MQRPLQITFRGMEHSDAIERRVRVRVKELEDLYPSITGCHVVIESVMRRHNKGNLYSARIDIRVPGSELVVNREGRRNPAHEDAFVAVRDAFDAAARQLEDYARIRRGRVKRHETPEHGKVTKIFWYEGFGFLETPDGLEIYFHKNSVLEDKFKTLEIGDEVRFVLDEKDGEKGPQASSVVKIGKHHLSPAP